MLSENVFKEMPTLADKSSDFGFSSGIQVYSWTQRSFIADFSCVCLWNARLLLDGAPSLEPFPCLLSSAPASEVLRRAFRQPRTTPTIAVVERAASPPITAQLIETETRSHTV